ncbi:PilZ domain-containing protein [Yoonia sp.]|uniref:PilZ domain-containing protein n=1 Tax=Yoonia sp. TaxID=2212373 RepID=UPI0035C79FB2
MKYRSHRYLTQYPVNVHTAQGLQRCEVLDVNHSGARLVGLENLTRGDRIQLDILSHRVEAIVLWSKTNQVGVAFRPHLPDHHLDTLRRQRGNKLMPQRGRVGFVFGEVH